MLCKFTSFTNRFINNLYNTLLKPDKWQYLQLLFQNIKIKTSHLMVLLSFLPFIVNSQDNNQNLQSYTPSVLFSSGQWEYKLFNNIYTQTKSFNSSGSKEKNVFRTTYFTNINQFLYGLNSQVNIGFDLWVKSVRANQSTSSSPFKVLSFADTPNSKTAITGFGPKIKIAPFKSLKRFSYQSTFLFPIGKDFEGREEGIEKPFLFLETDRYLWINDFFYDKQLNSKLNIFFRVSFWTSFLRNSYLNKTTIETPLDVFLSYFPNSRLAFYFQSEYWAKHFKLDSGTQTFKVFNAYFVQLGLGVKYQIIPGALELELLHTNFILGSEGAGAGKTFNFGIRVIR